jgi:UDP:flavonoid glycosyltransferase YjiC (YdhE family)
VLGTWGARTVPHGVEGVVAPDGLGAELDRSDLVVTAGGVTLLEALVRGLPTVAVTTAANQAVAVKALADAGATIAATVEGAPTIVEALAADADQRRALAREARIVLDGHGSHRIAHLASQVATAKALARVVDAEAHQHHLPPVVTVGAASVGE